MRISIRDENYRKLSPMDAKDLYEAAKRRLRVGFEIELNVRYPNDERSDQDRAEAWLSKIQAGFEERYGFVMAIGKGANNIMKLKKSFTDGRTRIEIPLEIDVDGYKEHLLVPYGYYDGSTPVELVMSPIEPSVKRVKDAFEKICGVVKEADCGLSANCINRCGLHQTVVYEHLEPEFPEIVAANVIQIARAYMPGLYHLFSSGNLEYPSRALGYRNHNQSVWRMRPFSSSKYCAIFPRTNYIGDRVRCWGIEFRYPDGTL